MPIKLFRITRQLHVADSFEAGTQKQLTIKVAKSENMFATAPMLE